MNSMVKNIVSTFSISAGYKLIFAALFCASVLCGCGGGDGVNNDIKLKDNDNGNNNHPIAGKAEGLSAEMALRIRQDYLNQWIENDPTGLQPSIDDIWIGAYYGTYNGCVAVLIHDGRGNTGIVTYTFVAGILFKYMGGGMETLIWNEGRFYALDEAYNIGLFTRNDLVDIAKINNVNLYLPNVSDDFYLDGNYAGLSVGVEDYIKGTYFSRFLEYGATIDDVWVESYYGNYNDTVVVMMGDNYNNYTNIERVSHIDGLLFRFNNENNIMVFRGMGYNELQAAYEYGWITRENLIDIADYHNQFVYSESPVY